MRFHTKLEIALDAVVTLVSIIPTKAKEKEGQNRAPSRPVEPLVLTQNMSDPKSFYRKMRAKRAILSIAD